jgi:hypothetical protein
MKEPRRPQTGDLVQLWDTSSPSEHEAKMSDHGKVGYVVGMSKRTDKFFDGVGREKGLTHIVEGDCYKVRFFEGDASSVAHVNYAWLRVLNDHDDIRSVEDV